jgi:EAL domain-containing protein (putative c-di-GMP-specific phosphodiesterase class I)
VAGLGRDPADTAIVKSVIDLAHALGLTVVAEGVETPEQADHLRRLGCDRAQGYHFARPLPAADLDPLLSGRPAVSAGLPGGGLRR